MAKKIMNELLLTPQTLAEVNIGINPAFLQDHAIAIPSVTQLSSAQFPAEGICMHNPASNQTFPGCYTHSVGTAFRFQEPLGQRAMQNFSPTPTVMAPCDWHTGTTGIANDLHRTINRPIELSALTTSWAPTFNQDASVNFFPQEIGVRNVENSINSLVSLEDEQAATEKRFTEKLEKKMAEMMEEKLRYNEPPQATKMLLELIMQSFPRETGEQLCSFLEGAHQAMDERLGTKDAIGHVAESMTRFLESLLDAMSDPIQAQQHVKNASKGADKMKKRLAEAQLALWMKIDPATNHLSDNADIKKYRDFHDKFCQLRHNKKRSMSSLEDARILVLSAEAHVCCLLRRI